MHEDSQQTGPVSVEQRVAPVADLEETDGEVRTPRRWAALAILLVAGFMDLLDTSIVNVAIPSIRRDIHASYPEIQWVVDGYLLAFAVGLITGGRLGDIAGRKRVFLVGVVGFGITSLGSGLAATPTVLVATRVLQGLSASLMIPQILSFIQVTFTRSEQTRALGLYGSVAGLALVSGGLTAGVLLDLVGWSWRSIFLINVPVCIFVTVAALAIVPESKASDVKRLDLGGVALVSLALFALVFGLVEGRELGWPIWVFAMMCAALPLFALFAYYEQRLERRGRSPLVPLTLFRQTSFSPGLAIILVFFSGVACFFLAFTVFLQFGLGFTPLEAALTTFPSPVGLVISSQIAVKLAPRFGRRILSTGALVMSVAITGIILTVQDHGSHLAAWDVRPLTFVFGLGMGLILPSLADTIIAGLHERYAGAASGVLNTGMQVGNAVGVAIIGLILFSALGSYGPESAAKAQTQLSSRLATLSLPGVVRERVVSDFHACFVASAREVNPAAVPAICRREGSEELSGSRSRALSVALSSATDQGRADDFVAAIQRALLYEVAVFVGTFVLLFLLPRSVKRGVEAGTTSV